MIPPSSDRETCILKTLEITPELKSTQLNKRKGKGENPSLLPFFILFHCRILYDCNYYIFGSDGC